MNWNVYLRGGKVFVPTTGIVDRSFYREMEPVAVVSAFDSAAVRGALHSAMARGNPSGPLYSPGTRPQPVVLKYAGLKSWSSFMRGCLSWSIKSDEGTYKIIADRVHPKGYWEENPNQTIEFPIATSVSSVIDRMIAILQDAAREQAG